MAFRKNISLTIGILETTSMFVESNIGALLVPLGTFLVMLVYLTYWIFVGAYLYSCGERIEREK